MAEYQPGVCNIGRAERRKRRLTGLFSLAVGVTAVGFVLGTVRPDWQLVYTFPLWFGAVLGFVQDRLAFCVGFGAMARYEISESGGNPDAVTDREAIRRDRRRALQVLAYAAVGGAAMTVLVYALGVAL